MKFWLGALCACMLASTCMAGATDTYDTIFRTGTLDGLPEATVITYAETGAGEDQIVRLTVGAENRTALVRIRGEQTGTVGEFPTDVGNPLVMYFMENAVRTVAERSGGSPFYIRNRFKEALLAEVPHAELDVRFDGQEIPAERLVLHPLAGDAHAEAAGVDDVALEVTVSPEVPGWYHTLAVTGGAGDDAIELRIVVSEIVEP